MSTSLKVLIVDDKEENLYLLESLLKSSGYEVVSARNGAEALELAKQAAPDLIISDILMPVMDGFALCRAWKQDPVLTRIPFVFYTATYTEPKDERFALSLGADMFVIKPKEPMEFLSLIREVLCRQQTGGLRKGTEAPPVAEREYLKDYNEAVVRKLEKKVEDLDRANRELRSALDDKATLLRELYHRTGNNMQLVFSLLQLEAMAPGGRDTGRLIADIEERIKALALVSRGLYESGNVSRIDLKGYLGELAKSVLCDYPAAAGRVKLELDVDPEEVLIDTAIPCGLVVNELLSNALKHAFPGGRRGTVWLRCRRPGEGEIELSVSDDGVGLPWGVDPGDPKTLGLRIVKVLVEQQLNGTLEIRSSDGVSCTARFKDALYAERV